FCSKSKRGTFRVKRKTSKKKIAAKLKANKDWLKANRHRDMKEIVDRLRRSLQGYYNYYCITDNITTVVKFRYGLSQVLVGDFFSPLFCIVSFYFWRRFQVAI